MSEIKQENEKPKTSQFSRNVILILMTAFFMTAAQYVVSPYLPSYSTAFGMPLVLIGCAALMISGLGLLSTTSWPLIYAFRIVSGFGLMMFFLTAGMAVLAMAPEYRAKAVGYFIVVSSAGALVAYGIGPYVYATIGIHGLFIAMVVFGLLAAVLILPFKLTMAKTIATPSAFGKLFKNPLVVLSGLISIITHGAAAAFAGLCATFAIQSFVGLPIADLGYIFIPCCIGAILAGAVCPPVLRKVGPKIAIISWPIIAIFAFAITAFVPALGHLGAIVTLFALFAVSQLFTVGEFAFLGGETLKRIPREVTVTYTNWIQTFQSAGQVVLPLIVGTILGTAGVTLAGYQITWLSLAGIIAIGLVLCIVFVALLPRYKITETVEQKQ
ncbi:MAG: MFS transporter [Candidatus Bathyarchaeia archaeon]